MKVWKTVLKESINDVYLPAGAEVICAKEQQETICIWYLCNPANGVTKRTFYVVGTGHETPEHSIINYLGTATLENGTFIFHIFEKEQD